MECWICFDGEADTFFQEWVRCMKGWSCYSPDEEGCRRSKSAGRGDEGFSLHSLRCPFNFQMEMSSGELECTSLDFETEVCVGKKHLEANIMMMNSKAPRKGEITQGVSIDRKEMKTKSPEFQV